VNWNCLYIGTKHIAFLFLGICYVIMSVVEEFDTSEFSAANAMPAVELFWETENLTI
jgi:hypothetical protein